MVFEVQRYLEDTFARRGFSDPDRYAVRLANLYDQQRAELSREDFLARMGRLRSVLFRANAIKPRRSFEESLLTDLDRKFKKKRTPEANLPLQETVTQAKQVLGNRRRTIGRLLAAVGSAIESRAVDAFWVRRTKSIMKPGPESIAQSLVAVALKGMLDGRGLVLRELGSGVGYVDIAVVLSRTLHLVELKILDGKFRGVSQLGEYMRLEGRKVGWLVLFDARRPPEKESIPESIAIRQGTVRTLVIDINPLPPSKISDK